jgi:hypothetical protein
MQTRVMQQRDVTHHSGFERLIGHSGATVFDHNGVAMPTPQVWQHFRDNLGALRGSELRCLKYRSLLRHDFCRSNRKTGV